MSDIVEVRRGRPTGRVFTTVAEVMATIAVFHRERGCDGMATDVHTCVGITVHDRRRWYQARDPLPMVVADEPGIGDAVELPW